MYIYMCVCIYTYTYIYLYLIKKQIFDFHKYFGCFTLRLFYISVVLSIHTVEGYIKQPKYLWKSKMCFFIKFLL